MLSAKALNDYKNFTKSRVALARYKAGGSYVEIPIDRVETLADGRVAFYCSITPGKALDVTELALLDTSKEVFYSKALTGNEVIHIKDASEGALVRFAYTVSDASGS